MEFRANNLPAFGVKAVDDAAAELKRLQVAADEAQKTATEANFALERAEMSDREERAAAIRSGKKPKADAADKARAKLLDLERVAADYQEAVAQSNHDLHRALTEHERKIRGLAAEREAQARTTMLEAVAALERGRGEFAQARALTKWLEQVAQGGIPSAEARRGNGRGTVAPPLNPAGYLARIPRPGRRDLGGRDDAFDFAEVLAAVRELVDPPPPAQPPQAQPLRAA